MIEITCQKNGFRRAGIAHPKGVTSYDDDFFSDAQLELMDAEPRLVVAVLAPGPAPGGDTPNETVAGVTETAMDEAIRQNRLVDAITMLDQDRGNRDHWTAAGLPQIAALESLTGLAGITAAERDEVSGLRKEA